MSPSELPQLTVTAVHAAECSARFEPSPWIGEGRIGCLYLRSGRFAWGRFCNVHLSQSACVFVPDDQTLLGQLMVGESYAYLEGYWGERAELVLDTARIWRASEFQPTADDGELVPGGWDHEHCSICHQKIGWGGQPNGFVSEDDWVCDECHSRFIIPRSLAFMR
jgi:hypothetical protein